MKAKYIPREYVEEIRSGLPLTGWELRRHTLALEVQKFACFVRGHHELAWEPNWKDWYCLVCGKMDEPKPPPPDGS